MKDGCGCGCGTAPAGPGPAANRPGLDALEYRAGTHGSFLRAMLGGLSGRLAALNTRSPSDASIALLDAWASVADVLTFYQERIANEGYLRTAAERRSVVELGRLVGYRLRPGVSATAYLAYQLEATARVRLEPGIQAQSVPGPGELPLTFETMDAVDARGEWNLLPVRLTRATDPAALAGLGADDTAVVYLLGITTGLGAGDPLLADFGAHQRLYRVAEVTADALADRTRVTIRPWSATSAHVALAQAETVPAPPVVEPTPEELVDELVTRHTDLEAAGVRRTGVIAERVVEELERLRTVVMLGMTGAELAGFLSTQTAPAIAVQRELTRRGRSAPLQAWLARLTADVDELVVRFTPAPEPAPVAPEATPSPALAAGGTATIGDVLDSLARPPSVPPADPLRLDRSVEDTFGAGSDVLPSLLGAMRPELAATLYAAWRNVPATPPSPLSVHALRTRAAPFGHNAPLEPMINSEGRVVGAREWTLRKQSGERVPESLEVVLVLPADALTGEGRRTGTARIVVRIRDAAREVTAPVDDLIDGPFTVDLPQAGERVLFTLTPLGDSPRAAAALRVVFDKRALVFGSTLELPRARELGEDPGRLTWRSEGTDPTEVRFTVTTAEPGSPPEGERPGQVVRMTITGLNRTPAGEVPTEQADVISLDATYPTIVPRGWVVVERPDELASPQHDALVIRRVLGVRDGSREDYGLVGRSTFVQLDGDWLRLGRDGDTFAVIRGSAVLAESEQLALVETPLDPVAAPLCGGEIPLDGLFDGLRPGRWLVVSGERTDVASDGVAVPGVPATELVMLAGVRQDYDPAEPGTVTRTTLVLAADLAYCYRRDTVRVFGNVVRATHGTTTREVLGSGDAGQPNQAFRLRQKPLTFVAAPTPSGVESSLAAYVDDVRWHEAPTPVGLAPTDRRFVTATGDDDTTTVVFGDGREGARLPTGEENVAAVYRTGLGRAGNVRADQLTLLGTRPQGVTGVTNPMPGAGGADREDRDQARRNIPLAVTALDRIVSVRDYADFARTFAGIDKASAVRLAVGRSEFVHLTVAGIDDVRLIPSDLHRNLRVAVREFGDPLQPVRIEERALRLMVVAARIRVEPDHRWEVVAPAIRAALLDRFAFARRDLGQDVTRGEVIGAIQAVAGVAYVDLDVLDTVGEDQVRALLGGATTALPLGLRSRLWAGLARVVAEPAPHVVPAELIHLSPDVPETLILEVLP